MNNDYIQMKEIGIRLKEERLKIGLDQGSPSELGGKKVQSNYENGL